VGVSIFLEDGLQGDDGAPGPAGVNGTSGTTGAQGPMGPPGFMDPDPPDDPMMVPGPVGPQGPQGQAGTGGGSTSGTPIIIPDDDPFGLSNEVVDSGASTSPMATVTRVSLGKVVAAGNAWMWS
jgi:hypothetical protein